MKLVCESLYEFKRTSTNYDEALENIGADRTRQEISAWMKSIDEEDTDDNALAECSKHGKTEWVKYLLAQGADVHYINDYALRWASEEGHLEIVKLLLDYGADVHAEDDLALQWASGKGHKDVVELLTKYM